MGVDLNTTNLALVMFRKLGLLNIHMNVANNFLDDYLPVTSVDAIGVMQNFDLLNIRNLY